MTVRAVRAGGQVEQVSAPQHWLLDRDAVRRRIDAATIVERAHALVHDGGSAALSMRTLASSLDTSTSAVYRHVPSKQWLLIAIVDFVLGEVAIDPAHERDAPARGRLEALSRSYREVLAAHPHLHEILTSHVALTPRSVRIAEAAFACLRDLGIRTTDLVDAYNVWCGYVIGFTILETKPAEHSPDQELQEVMRAQLSGDAAAYPIVTELLPDLANQAYGLRWVPERLGNGHASFEWGLDIVLDGFEARGARKRRTKG